MKESITFEIKSLLKFQLEMKVYPELTSPKRWVQKGLNILKKHAPRVLRYLSREKVIAQLKDYSLIMEAPDDSTESRVKTTFKIWVQKEKAKRLFFVILEGLVLPLTPILALLPGPNVFFYIPALLIYYHLRSYLGLRKVDVDDLPMEIVPIT